MAEKSANNLTEKELDEIECFVCDLVKEAGDLVRKRFKEAKKVEIKSHALDLVTETDQDVEGFLVAGIKKKFPEHLFIGEETVGAGGSPGPLTEDPTWICDPVDGTMNFVHEFPFCAIALALVVNKKPVLAFVNNPNLNLFYRARSGHGAFLNDSPLQVSSVKKVSEALVFTEMHFAEKDPRRMQAVRENLEVLISETHAWRYMGSCVSSMCMVAQGAGDGHFTFHTSCWDVAASGLMIQEAGGVVIDPSGGPWDVMSGRAISGATMELCLELSKKLTFY